MAGLEGSQKPSFLRNLFGPNTTQPSSTNSASSLKQPNATSPAQPLPNASGIAVNQNEEGTLTIGLSFPDGSTLDITKFDLRQKYPIC